jgi:hypothetical protein
MSVHEVVGSVAGVVSGEVLLLHSASAYVYVAPMHKLGSCSFAVQKVLPFTSIVHRHFQGNVHAPG